MKQRLSQIQHIVSELKGVSIEVPFSLDEHMNILGKVSVKIEELPDALDPRHDAETKRHQPPENAHRRLSPY